MTEEMTALEHLLSALDANDWNALVQTAEDAASWCELASIGDVYAEEDFEILITE